MRLRRAEDRRIAAGSTKSLAAIDAPAVVELDTLTGSVVTLPGATGSRKQFRFVVTVVPTSNSHIVKVANAVDVMAGFAVMAQDAADTALMFETAATSDTITLNRTTSGGTQKGETIEVEDIAAGLWLVRAHLAGTGVEVTPFSAAV